MKSRPLLRTLSGTLVVVYFATNCAFGYRPETNVWDERRAALSPRQALGRGLGSFQENLDPGQKLAGMTNITDFGTLQKTSSTKSSNRTVLHIQDVHMNLEAQRNIGLALQSRMEKGEVDLIALEGAFGPIDLVPFQKFPHPDSVRKVADYLLKENQISGPIHTVMTVPSTSFLVPSKTKPGTRNQELGTPVVIGVDDQSLYNANVEAYRQSANQVNALKEQLRRQKLTLADKKRRTFNPDLAALDATMQAYAQGKMTMAAYVRQLPVAGPQLKIFTEALQMEASLNFSHVEEERAALLQKLFPHLSQSESTNLKNTSVAYRMGNMGHMAFYVYLRDLCEKKQLSFGTYPQLNTYLRYVQLADQVDGGILLKEVRQAEVEALAARTKTPEEKALLAESRRHFLTEKLVDFALNKQEWDEYSSSRQAFGRDPGSIHENLGPGQKHSGATNLSSFENFYRFAEKRDHAMAENLLRAMDTYKAKSVVLVTGGFHSSGIGELAHTSGLSTQIFVPKITKIDTENGSAYLNVFSQEKTPLEKLFEGEKLFLARAPITPFDLKVGVPARILGTEEAKTPEEIDAAQEAAIWKGLDADPRFSALANDQIHGKARVVVRGDGLPGVDVDVTLDGNAIARIEEKQTETYDTRPEKAGLLHSAYIRHDMMVKAVVNPDNKPLVAVYGGAGADISNFLLSTNARIGYFVAHYAGLTASDLLEIKKVQERLGEAYRGNKQVVGFAFTQEVNQKDSLVRALAHELMALGVNLNEVTVDEIGGHPRIRFPWSYLGQTPNQVQIVFIDADITSPDLYPEYLSTQIKQGFDVYYQRAGLKISLHYDDKSNNFLSYLYQHMRTGGYFVTDDYASDTEMAPVLDRGANFVKGVEQISLSDKDLQHEIRTFSGTTDGYGWDVRIRKKVDDKSLGRKIINRVAASPWVVLLPVAVILASLSYDSAVFVTVLGAMLTGRQSNLDSAYDRLRRMYYLILDPLTGNRKFLHISTPINDVLSLEGPIFLDLFPEFQSILEKPNDESIESNIQKVIGKIKANPDHRTQALLSFNTTLKTMNGAAYRFRIAGDKPFALLFYKSAWIMMQSFQKFLDSDEFQRMLVSNGTEDIDPEEAQMSRSSFQTLPIIITMGDTKIFVAKGLAELALDSSRPLKEIQAATSAYESSSVVLSALYFFLATKGNAETSKKIMQILLDVNRLPQFDQKAGPLLEFLNQNIETLNDQQFELFVEGLLHIGRKNHVNAKKLNEDMSKLSSAGKLRLVTSLFNRLQKAPPDETGPKLTALKTLFDATKRFAILLLAVGISAIFSSDAPWVVAVLGAMLTGRPDSSNAPQSLEDKFKTALTNALIKQERDGRKFAMLLTDSAVRALLSSTNDPEKFKTNLATELKRSMRGTATKRPKERPLTPEELTTIVEQLTKEFANPEAHVTVFGMAHGSEEDLDRHFDELEKEWQAARAANQQFVVILDFGGPNTDGGLSNHFRISTTEQPDGSFEFQITPSHADLLQTLNVKYFQPAMKIIREIIADIQSGKKPTEALDVPTYWAVLNWAKTHPGTKVVLEQLGFESWLIGSLAFELQDKATDMAEQGMLSTPDNLKTFLAYSDAHSAGFKKGVRMRDAAVSNQAAELARQNNRVALLMGGGHVNLTSQLRSQGITAQTAHSTIPEDAFHSSVLSQWLGNKKPTREERLQLYLRDSGFTVLMEFLRDLGRKDSVISVAILQRACKDWTNETFIDFLALAHDEEKIKEFLRAHLPAEEREVFFPGTPTVHARTLHAIDRLLEILAKEPWVEPDQVPIVEGILQKLKKEQSWVIVDNMKADASVTLDGILHINKTSFENFSDDDIILILSHEVQHLRPINQSRRNTAINYASTLRTSPVDIPTNPKKRKIIKKLAALLTRNETEAFLAQFQILVYLARENGKDEISYVQSLSDHLSETFLPLVKMPREYLLDRLSFDCLVYVNRNTPAVLEIVRKTAEGELNLKPADLSTRVFVPWVLSWLNDPEYYNPPNTSDSPNQPTPESDPAFTKRLSLLNKGELESFYRIRSTLDERVASGSITFSNNLKRLESYFLDRLAFELVWIGVDSNLKPFSLRCIKDPDDNAFNRLGGSMETLEPFKYEFNTYPASKRGGWTHRSADGQAIHEPVEPILTEPDDIFDDLVSEEMQHLSQSYWRDAHGWISYASTVSPQFPNSFDEAAAYLSQQMRRWLKGKGSQFITAEVTSRGHMEPQFAYLLANKWVKAVNEELAKQVIANSITNNDVLIIIRRLQQVFSSIDLSPVTHPGDKTLQKIGELSRLFNPNRRLDRLSNTWKKIEAKPDLKARSFILNKLKEDFNDSIFHGTDSEALHQRGVDIEAIRQALLAFQADETGISDAAAEAAIQHVSRVLEPAYYLYWSTELGLRIYVEQAAMELLSGNILGEIKIPFQPAAGNLLTYPHPDILTPVAERTKGRSPKLDALLTEKVSAYRYISAASQEDRRSLISFFTELGIIQENPIGLHSLALLGAFGFGGTWLGANEWLLLGAVVLAFLAYQYAFPNSIRGPITIRERMERLKAGDAESRQWLWDNYKRYAVQVGRRNYYLARYLAKKLAPETLGYALPIPSINDFTQETLLVLAALLDKPKDLDDQYVTTWLNARMGNITATLLAKEWNISDADSRLIVAVIRAASNNSPLTGADLVALNHVFMNIQNSRETLFSDLSIDQNEEQILDNHPQTNPFDVGNTSVMDVLEQSEELTARDIVVLTKRFGLDGGLPMFFEDIGKIFGISLERARQIEIKALVKAKGALDPSSFNPEGEQDASLKPVFVGEPDSPVQVKSRSVLSIKEQTKKRFRILSRWVNNLPLTQKRLLATALQDNHADDRPDTNREEKNRLKKKLTNLLVFRGYGQWAQTWDVLEYALRDVAPIHSQTNGQAKPNKLPMLGIAAFALVVGMAGFNINLDTAAARYTVVAILTVSLLLHEMGHAYVSYRAGNWELANEQGRFSPKAFWGKLDRQFLKIYGITAALGVPFLGLAVHLRYQDLLNKKVILAGPAVNLVLATIVGTLWLLGTNVGFPENVLGIMGTAISINLSLGIFNLIPLLPGMDGDRLLLRRTTVEPRIAYNYAKVYVALAVISYFVFPQTKMFFALLAAMAFIMGKSNERSNGLVIFQPSAPEASIAGVLLGMIVGGGKDPEKTAEENLLDKIRKDPSNKANLLKLLDAVEHPGPEISRMKGEYISLPGSSAQFRFNKVAGLPNMVEVDWGGFFSAPLKDSEDVMVFSSGHDDCISMDFRARRRDTGEISVGHAHLELGSKDALNQSGNIFAQYKTALAYLSADYTDIKIVMSLSDSMLGLPENPVGHIVFEGKKRGIEVLTLFQREKGNSLHSYFNEVTDSLNTRNFSIHFNRQGDRLTTAHVVSWNDDFKPAIVDLATENSIDVQTMARQHAKLFKEIAAESQISATRIEEILHGNMLRLSDIRKDGILLSSLTPLQMNEYTAALQQELHGWNKLGFKLTQLVFMFARGIYVPQDLPNKNQFIVVKDDSDGQIAYAQFMRATLKAEQTLYIACPPSASKIYQDLFKAEKNVTLLLADGMFKGGVFDGNAFEQNVRELKQSTRMSHVFDQTVIILTPEMAGDFALRKNLEDLGVQARPLADWLPGIERGNYENILRAAMAAWKAA